MAGPEDITLVQNAFHNPTEPRHFMQVVPASRRTVARVGDVTLADSTTALVCKEVARDIYDPIIYFPRDDIDMGSLTRIDKSTHCPLKGDTEYFDITAGDRRISAAAWSYVDVIGDHGLAGLIAFDCSVIDIA